MKQPLVQIQSQHTLLELAGSGPDFARGIRTELNVTIEPNDDYARGLRKLPKNQEIKPDFARGIRQLPQDISIHSDYARGLRTEN